MEKFATDLKSPKGTSRREELITISRSEKGVQGTPSLVLYSPGGESGGVGRAVHESLGTMARATAIVTCLDELNIYTLMGI